jgi:MFS family permease
LQGFGAAGSIVIARSVASDWSSGNELLKFLALIAAVQGIAPAVLGASTFLVGGIVMPLSGIGNILHSTCYVIIGCAALVGITSLSANKNNQ